MRLSNAALLVVSISLTPFSTSSSQSPADSVAIRQTALDYIQGWYAGDAARMERALHPELAKRIVQT
ncbi:MAG TPA: nuclear transport factor 2 family protein, partial [Gemmatimonadaceae bacterium]|nr:nuclear transport factor 2 family protein [Gemmatimonadaceae bacterium]